MINTTGGFALNSEPDFGNKSLRALVSPQIETTVTNTPCTETCWLSRNKSQARVDESRQNQLQKETKQKPTNKKKTKQKKPNPNPTNQNSETNNQTKTQKPTQKRNKHLSEFSNDFMGQKFSLGLKNTLI